MSMLPVIKHSRHAFSPPHLVSGSGAVERARLCTEGREGGREGGGGADREVISILIQLEHACVCRLSQDFRHSVKSVKSHSSCGFVFATVSQTKLHSIPQASLLIPQSIPQSTPPRARGAAAPCAPCLARLP